MHISDCVETVYEVQLLSNNTASATLLNKLGAVRNVDWIFIIWGVGLTVTGRIRDIGKKFYSLLFEQEVAAAPLISTFSFRFRREGLH